MIISKKLAAILFASTLAATALPAQAATTTSPWYCGSLTNWTVFCSPEPVNQLCLQQYPDMNSSAYQNCVSDTATQSQINSTGVGSPATLTNQPTQTTNIPTTYGCTDPQNPNCKLAYVPLEPLSSSGGQDIYQSLASYLKYLFPILITAGALWGVLMFTVNGIIYMTSDVVGNKNKATERMRASIWGLLLLVSSVLILQTVNPNLITFNLTSLGQLTQLGTNTNTTNSSGTSATTNSTGGTVGVISTPTQTTDITNAQNAARTADPAAQASTLSKAGQDIAQDENYCTNTLHGVVSKTGELGNGGGCANDSPQHYYSSSVFNSCSNIYTTSNQIEACFYNQ